MAIAMNRFVSLNNFPPVSRTYCLTPFYPDLAEDVRYKKYFNKPFYTVEGENILTNALFLPQNHKCFHYLNMFSETYFRIGHLGDPEQDPEQILCDEFADEAIRVIKREILQRMSETSCPDVTSRLTRSLIRYGQIARCIDRTERIALTRFCLTTIYIKARRDYEAVVEILINFCCTSRIYLYEIYSHYWEAFIRYIFESCVKARFNFRYFISQHPDNSTPGVDPVCPILENLLLGDYLKLSLFLEFGFERYPPSHTSMRNAYLRITQQMVYHLIELPEVDRDANNEQMQRYSLVLETTYFICESLHSHDPRQWDAIARLIWKSIPDAFLTVSEVIGFVAAGADERTIERITARCHSEMFRSILTDVLQPRRLEHLCRCAVRRAIGRNFLLPRGIHDVGLLPQTVVDYLDILNSDDDH